MKTIPTIQLERLLLRPFSLEDAKAVQEIAGDPYIAAMTLNIPHPYGDGIAEAWIKTHSSNFDEDKSLSLAIVHKESKNLIGAISLGFKKEFDHGELGYWIGREYKNNGYCTEAARGLVSYAFEKLNLHRVYARYLSKNPASGRVMEKIGMKYEGLLRQHIKKNGVYEDIVHYGLLRDEYKSENYES